MSEVAQEQSEEQAEAEVLAGYNNSTRADAPVEVAPVEEPVEPAEPEIEAEPIPSVATLAEELKALKARVAASANDPNVRRLHGEVGSINRTLQQLQRQQAPAGDDLAAAMLDAEKVAEEFPELAAPLVKALRASVSRNQPVDIEERVNSAVEKIRHTDAMESLRDEHPDYETVRETNEYRNWLSSKTPEFQDRFLNTWNPAVVSRGLTELKDSLKVRERKQSRLASAVTPQGVPQQGESSVISDEEALMLGYNSGPKRQINKR